MFVCGVFVDYFDVDGVFVFCVVVFNNFFVKEEMVKLLVEVGVLYDGFEDYERKYIDDVFLNSLWVFVFKVDEEDEDVDYF